VSFATTDEKLSFARTDEKESRYRPSFDSWRQNLFEKASLQAHRFCGPKRPAFLSLLSLFG
jgi:hypothetical protein